MGHRDYYANTHISYPELDPTRSCYSPVEHREGEVRVKAPPIGCAYPSASERASLRTLADRLEDSSATAAHLRASLYPCKLPPAQAASAIAHNTRALRTLADDAKTYPYAAVIVPGFGAFEEGQTALVGWLPGDGCRRENLGDAARLRTLIERSQRGAQTLQGSVAPLVIVTGGAIHSSLNESFAMLHILQCSMGVLPTQVLVEPCAEHTHTNLRNAGRWLTAMGARVGYLVTDDGIQSRYFQDFSGFEAILGSIDQRSIRDFGYVLGSWRQASVGIDAGFWFTPYRFWAEPRDGVGSITCMDPNL
ncbi:MAG: hypothetical protein NVS3B20_22530 [Polyangiales bacterium]